MVGSALYQQMLAFDYGDTERNELMRKVWSGTPWMVNAWTGSPDDDEFRWIMDWCRERWGPEAWPLHDRGGTWQRGGATIHGWTWFGFATEAMMQEFAERWRILDEAGR